ncbi:hypothetical protein [Actinoplanes sp. NPDC049681]|uniref:hypothetical protein n=1 Tax=Actinoplanes sp. NPDC049681 TaxID=3363905 RepID=UPI0037BC7B3E
MTARTMRQLRRTGTAHTEWCARDHRCDLGEHRAEEVVVDLPGHGRAVLTRVKGLDGREHAEIRVRVVLHTEEAAARWQLRTVLNGFRQLIAHVAIRPGIVRNPCNRPALTGHPSAPRTPNRRHAA